MDFLSITLIIAGAFLWGLSIGYGIIGKSAQHMAEDALELAEQTKKLADLIRESELDGGSDLNRREPRSTKCAGRLGKHWRN